MNVKAFVPLTLAYGCTFDIVKVVKWANMGWIALTARFLFEQSDC